MLIRIKNTKTSVTVKDHETKINVKKSGISTISVITPKKLDTVVTVTPNGEKTVTHQPKLSSVTVVERGLQGIPGISAYQHAVNEGFEGSLLEWLESLRGKDGVDGRDGKDGRDGIDGKDGVDGLSALEQLKAAYPEAFPLIDENDDPSLTQEQKDIESLKALLQGPAGKDGKDGADGQDGKDGENGKSAYELALQEGFQGSLSDWLETLKGKDGLDGKDGEDGLSSYELALLQGFSGSVHDWLESLKGEKGSDGLNGLDGRDGVDGKDGKDGLSAYQVAEAHGFTGSEQEWLESLKGSDGKDGVDGIDGVDGKDGRDGIDAQYYDENGPVTNVKTFVTTLSVSKLSSGSFSVDYSHVGFSRIINVQVSAEASGDSISDRRLVFISHNSVTTTGLSGVLLSSTSAGLLVGVTLVTADEGKIHITVVGV